MPKTADEIAAEIAALESELELADTLESHADAKYKAIADSQAKTREEQYAQARAQIERRAVYGVAHTTENLPQTVVDDAAAAMTPRLPPDPKGKYEEYLATRPRSGTRGYPMRRKRGSPPVPICGAITKAGTPCKRPAGSGTSHFGEGRCRFHGGDALSYKARRYAALKNPQLRQLMEDIAEDENPLDLTPELTLLRAITINYINNFEDLTAALLDWHASYCEGREDVTKPTQLPTLAEAHKLLDSIAKTVKTIDTLGDSHAVDRKSLMRILTEMGRAVDALVKDDDTKAKIRDAWLNIQLA